MSSKKLIKNVKILTMQDNEENILTGDILIEGQYINEVGQVNTIIDKDTEIINGDGCIALPGLINCHTHAAMTLLRGYADDMELMPWLQEKIWPMEAKLGNEHVYWGTMLAALEMIKSGTTTFADMYFFMDDTAKAVQDSGIRAVLSRGMIGLNDNELTSYNESKRFILDWHGKVDARITCMLGPHAPYTCPPAYLEKVIELAEELETGVHIHLAETRKELEDIRKEFGKTPVKHLYDLGMLKLPVLAAHCVHLTEEDIAIIKETNTGVAHNPTSNMKLASGMAPIPQMLEKDINVGIGTDGTASNNNLNMFEEMHIASLLHKVSWENPTYLPASKVLQMGTILGAKALGMSDSIGSIETGKKADIILVDFNKPHLTPCHDIAANLIYSAQASDVKTVIIDGKIVMRNREVLSLDEEKVMYEAQRFAELMNH